MASTADDWIEWPGGAQPLADGTIVVARCAPDDWETAEAPAGQFDWTRPSAFYDITSYRVVASPVWHSWVSGPCPVPTDATVEVRLRAHEKAGHPSLRIRADLLNWRFNDDSGDIIAYRVVKP